MCFIFSWKNKYLERITACSDRVTRISSKKCEAGVSASKIGWKKIRNVEELVEESETLVQKNEGALVQTYLEFTQ